MLDRISGGAFNVGGWLAGPLPLRLDDAALFEVWAGRRGGRGRLREAEATRAWLACLVSKPTLSLPAPRKGWNVARLGTWAGRALVYGSVTGAGGIICSVATYAIKFEGLTRLLDGGIAWGSWQQ